jgi:hypothetical protein
MPDVPGAPYEPYPTTQITERPIPLERPAVTGAAFGENVANALSVFGGDAQKAGDELWTRAVALQRLKNEADARNTAISATQDMAVEQSKFDTLEGKARSDALVPHLKALDSIRQRYRSSLGNLEAQSFFDNEAANLQNRFTVQAAARAGEGLKEYIDG